MEKNVPKSVLNQFDKIDLGLAAINDFYKTLCSAHLHAGGYDAYYTGIDSPFFNVILPSNKHALISPKLVQELTHFLIDRKLPWSLMQIMSSSSTTWDDEQVLQALQLQQMGFNLLEAYPNLYFDLTQQLPIIASNAELQNC